MAILSFPVPTVKSIPFNSAWLSTKYSLPRTAFPVLVAYQSRQEMHVCLAMRYTSAQETRWYAGQDYLGTNETVLWWMPMPEAPGES